MSETLKDRQAENWKRRRVERDGGTWVSTNIHGGEREMRSVGKCPKCGSGKTWRVGNALGGSPNTCACHSCNSYFQLEVVA